MHVGDALPGGEIGSAQARHRQAGGDRRSSVFAFRLDKNEGPIGDIEVAFGGRVGPILAHLSEGVIG